MSIKVPELITEIRNLLDEDNPNFWKDHHIRGYINRAIRYIFGYCYDADEDAFLNFENDGLPYEIVINDTNVTDNQLVYDVPDGTIYISNYVVPQYPRFVLPIPLSPSDKVLTTASGATFHSIDYRPLFKTNTASRRLQGGIDYKFDSMHFVLFSPPGIAGSIFINYKAKPARINSETAEIKLPDLLTDIIIEMALRLAHRKDEHPETIGDSQVPNDFFKEELAQARQLIAGMGGKPRGFEPNWDSIYDFGYNYGGYWW